MKPMKEPKDIMAHVEEYGVMKKQSVESARRWQEKEKQKPVLSAEEQDAQDRKIRRKGIRIAVVLGVLLAAIAVFFLLVDTDALDQFLTEL